MTGEPAPQQPETPESGGSPPRRPADDVEYRCDLCGAPMHEWHCRIICNSCGYQRDCSDP
jgi:hypothetical protein